jgi:hypothetical protein
MFSTSKIAKSRLWPKFLRQSQITQQKTIDKAFAKVGLKDCKGAAPEENDSPRTVILDFIESCEYPSTQDKRLLDFAEAVVVLRKAAMVVNSKLIASASIYDRRDRVICAKGKSAAKMMLSFIEKLVDHSVGYDDDLLVKAKALCGAVVNKNKLRIVFSTDPWDIATMSMRGIYSCQRWDGNSEHKVRLVGTILDPCAGVIYLTDGTKTRYGEKMLARSVVRLVAQYGYNNHVFGPIATGPLSERLALFVESSYVNEKFGGDIEDTHPDTDMSEYFQKVFTQFLNTKSKTIKVQNRTGVCIPLSKTVASLPEEVRSYIDSDIPYGKVPNLPIIPK